MQISWSNYGPAIVSECSKHASGSHPRRMISVSYEQRSVVTALSGTFGHSWQRWERKGTARQEQSNVCGDVIWREGPLRKSAENPPSQNVIGTKLKCVCKQLIINTLVVEAAGVELFSVLITRKLLIPGTATTAKKAPMPDPLYVYCTKMLCGLESHRHHIETTVSHTFAGKHRERTPASAGRPFHTA